MAGILDRLIGLETEYAIRFRSSGSVPSPSKFRLYESLVSAVARRIPVVRAKHFKEGMFLANGGAIWFEAERPAAGGGLIEGATPECRGPVEVLAYQRAMDRLVADAAVAARAPGSLTLIKNDRDSRGSVYGAQENYEVTLAEGWRLYLWWTGLVLLFPLAVLTWALVFACVLLTLAYFLCAAMIYLPCRLLSGGHERLSILLFGRDLTEGRDKCIHLPVWLESVLQTLTRAITAPLACALFLLLKFTAFVEVRRKLLPFLVSRVIFSGSGWWDSSGRYHLADKGPAINCVLGFGGIIGDRPIYTMGHFFKMVYAESWFSPREYGALFARRQRLQIAIGDSNMSDVAQLLRVGTTALVLDAIDNGFFSTPPRLRSAIGSLRAFCADVTLRRTVPLVGEGPVSALELQRFYYSACRAFVGSRRDAPRQAWEILHRWQQVLVDLEQLSAGNEPPARLIGAVDWYTKKYLLDRAGDGASWSERKKIDLRYHELSSDGYHTRLRDAGLVPEILEEGAIERATRTPPPNSPATMRGHYIREFGGGSERMVANWRSITFGHGWKKRVVRLSQYAMAAGASRRASNRARGSHGRPRAN